MLGHTLSSAPRLWKPYNNQSNARLYVLYVDKVCVSWQKLNKSSVVNYLHRSVSQKSALLWYSDNQPDVQTALQPLGCVPSIGVKTKQPTFLVTSAKGQAYLLHLSIQGYGSHAKVAEHIRDTLSVSTCCTENNGWVADQLIQNVHQICILKQQQR